jgi:hypothetical protein
LHADEVYRQFRQMIFSVQSVSLVTCAHQEPHSLPASSCQRIGFVKSHKGTLTSNAIEQAVEAGDVVFLRPWTDTSICAQAGKQLEVFLIEFAFWTEAASSGTERTFLQGTADFPLEKSFHVRSHSQVLHLMEELHKSLDAVETRELFRQRLLFERILYILARDYCSIKNSENTLGSIEETIEYVEQHYMLNLTLETLAGKANVSPSYYSRIFKTLKGVSFSDYITRLRIDRAKVLLDLPASRLREVAQSAGRSLCRGCRFDRVCRLACSAHGWQAGRGQAHLAASCSCPARSHFAGCSGRTGQMAAASA